MARFVTACLLALCPALAFAQAPPAVPPPPPPAREGSVEFAFVGTTGNTSTQTIGLGGEAIVRPPKWVVRNRAAFVRNESGGTLTAESFQYLFRTERVLSPRLSAFGEYAYFRDRFAGIEQRHGLAGGVAYKIVNRPRHLLSLDGGLGYLNERRATGRDVSSGTYAFSEMYRWKFSSTAELTDELRFAGIFDEAADWRLAHVVALAARLTTLFSLKASHSIRYANTPVPGFKNTDGNTAIALVAKF